ncbi:cytochrome P450 [Streptomyces caatingaensis]|uniref:Cytochrome P450 n=1 Tax=Streptomyces caatingaensis TaxID=1678637 RepID=A0A0K9XFD9_9ACTN|nr:cytochrome P450 [Streptomyces caatingaensis]
MHGPEFAADPHAVYRRLRAHGPVAPVELAPGVGAHLVTDYRAALEVLRSPGTFAKDPRRWRDMAEGRIAPDNPVVPMMAYRPNCLFTDGEQHRRLRGAVTDSLERIDPNALRGYVERSADTLIDRFAPAGEADLLGSYAKVLPLLVFNQLFGCPPELGDRLVEGMTGIFDGVDAERANTLVYTTLTELIGTKRRQPGADMTSWLMAHPARLTDEEMIHQIVVLMGAGTQPQQNLVAGALRLLLCDDRFAGDLAGGSMPVDDALDEVLWLDPPMANYGVHYPTADVDFAGVRLRAGDPVVVSFAAANTDPALRPERHSGQRTGNRAHLAWSAGPHHCPAKSPARLIASVAVERLLDRLPDLELAVPADRLAWRPGPFHRALAALPVRFPPQPVPVRQPAPSGAAHAGPGAAHAAPASPHAGPGAAHAAPASPHAGPGAGHAAPASPHAGPASPYAAPAAPHPAPGVPHPAPGAPHTAPAPPVDVTAETPGDSRWNPPSRPSGSTPPAGTSTARPPASAPGGRRPPWNSLVAWWHGR